MPLHLAPIAFFVYNRPEHTRQTLKALKRNLLASESELFIFSDGPKTEFDRDQVNKVREVIKGIDGFRAVKIIEHQTNYGLAQSIIRGVNELMSCFDQVIVFEDDLISAPHTLQYFNDALTRYASEPKVMHVGAYMYPLQTKYLSQTFFYRAATSWGWATWKRAWKYFEPDIHTLIQRFDHTKIHQFSIEGKMNYWRQVQEFTNGKNNSWAIRWYASIFLNGGLTLNPSHSLIHNIGHDGSGVHSAKTTMYDVKLNPRRITFFPDRIQENERAYYALKYFFTHRKGNWLQRILRFLKAWLEKQGISLPS